MLIKEISAQLPKLRKGETREMNIAKRSHNFRSYYSRNIVTSSVFTWFDQSLQQSLEDSLCYYYILPNRLRFVP